jgi:hypothetical protein
MNNKIKKKKKKPWSVKIKERKPKNHQGTKDEAVPSIASRARAKPTTEHRLPRRHLQPVFPFPRGRTLLTLSYKSVRTGYLLLPSIL